MTEQDIFAALGVEDPNAKQDNGTEGAGAATGENAPQGSERESEQPETDSTQTEPEDDAEEQGANDRGNAEPETTGDNSGNGGEAETAKTQEGRKPKGQKDAAQAERRRQQELDARVNAEVERRLAEIRKQDQQAQEQMFSELNLRDNKSGKQIRNMTEYREWRTAANAEKLSKDLRNGKLTPDALQQMINDMPVMQNLQRRQQEEDNRRRQEADSKSKAEIDRQLQEINKLDPSIKTVADFRNMPNWDQFYQLVRRGNTFLDAYRLVNYDKLMQSAASQQAAAASQRAINNARSKDHLKTDKQQGSGSVGIIPKDELELFHRLTPELSDKEIDAYWRKQHKK